MTLAETNLWLSEFRHVLDAIDSAIREQRARGTEVERNAAAGTSSSAAGKGP